MGKVDININMDEIAYAYWSCMCVGKSYGETKFYDYDKIYWIPKLVPTPKLPLPSPSCKNHKNWECTMVLVMLEESEAREASEFIRQSGGLVTESELSSHRETQLLPLKIKREKQSLASKKSSMARRLEKNNPGEAITLYRKSIDISMDAIAFLPEQLDYRDFPYLYNRLTLFLEKFGRFREALKEIEKYEALPCHEMGSKSERESIKKRKIRLQRKKVQLS